MTKRTITLTGRPPVVITESDWPIIASARDRWSGDLQNHIKWFIAARRHTDGRAIVYATYLAVGPNGHTASVRRGLLLPSDATHMDIAEAIIEVGLQMGESDQTDEDIAIWGALSQLCVADLPAEAI